MGQTGRNPPVEPAASSLAHSPKTVRTCVGGKQACLPHHNGHREPLYLAAATFSAYGLITVSSVGTQLADRNLAPRSR